MAQKRKNNPFEKAIQQTNDLKAKFDAFDRNFHEMKDEVSVLPGFRSDDDAGWRVKVTFVFCYCFGSLTLLLVLSLLQLHSLEESLQRAQLEESESPNLPSKNVTQVSESSSATSVTEARGGAESRGAGHENDYTNYWKQFPKYPPPNLKKCKWKFSGNSFFYDLSLFSSDWVEGNLLARRIRN